MNKIQLLMASAITALTVSFVPVLAQDKEEPKQTLFVNVNVWNGTSDSIASNQRVLVEGKLIKAIGDETLKANKDATVIDGGGSTLMPGLIDMHTHLALFRPINEVETTWDGFALGAIASESMRSFLDRGYTTIREICLGMPGIARAIERGIITGPRYYHGGACLSGIGYVVDGRAAIMSAARHNLQMGATQLKMMGGGGVATEYDPWHSTTYTLDEMKAIVDVAKGYGTYVMSHLNQPESISMALDAGIISIEHGFVIDEPTMKKVVEKGAYLSAQITGLSNELTNLPSLTPENLRKLKLAHSQTTDFIALVKKFKPKQVFAVDAVLATRDNYKRQRRHEIWLSAKTFGNFEMLKSATSTAGELASLTKLTNYHDGKLGVIEEGAYADILLVDGNPLKDVSAIGGSELWLKAPKPTDIKTIRIIMKDGKIYKNTLK